MIRVVLADDHQILREGLKRILADAGDIDVVAEASTGDAALACARALRPDVVLLDVSMPGGGLRILDLIRLLGSQAPESRVLLLSMHSEGPLAIRALRAGAVGYVTKAAPPSELVTAIRRVSSGHKYLSPELAEALAEEWTHDPDEPPHRRLSEREFQVLCMLGTGKTIQEIARDLALEPKTVSTYRSRIEAKLGLRGTTALALYAFEHELRFKDS